MSSLLLSPFDAFYRTQVHVVAYGIPVALFQAVGKVYLAYHGGEHVAAFQVEVVVGAVKVGGHHGNVVRTILKIELSHIFQSGYFGDGIGLVRVFQRRSEECVFFHRLFGITGIDAGAAQKEKFFHSVAEAFADDVLLYLQVLVDEVGTVDTVGMMPPTKAAARNTYSGCSSSKKRRTATPSSRSSSVWVLPMRLVYPFSSRFFQMAEPTSPRWPATYILAFLSNIVCLKV